jgi:2'-5' RNA ligase
MSYNYAGGELGQASIKKYAVVLYLPQRVERYVASLRERFDPDYDIVAAHITLVFPWESAIPLTELSAVIAEEAKKCPPVKVQLESVGDFYPGAPIIYWAVSPEDQLRCLYRHLYAHLDLPLPFKDLIPHVTVAKEISPHRVMMVKDQIASYLPRESFEARSIDLISPVADHHWVSVRTFPLLGT